MKKVMIWTGIILMTPLLLFVLLTVLLYLPPVQDWAVRQVTTAISESTGMNVSMDRLRMAFPLDLSIEGVKVVQPGKDSSRQCDTIARVGRMVADVQLCPLLEQKVMVNRLAFQQLNLNTLDLIATAQIKGSLDELTVKSRLIDLKSQTVDVEAVVLKGADVNVWLKDTVPPDTSSEPVTWKIKVATIDLLDSRVALAMAGDTMRIQASLDKATATATTLDLFKEEYAVGRLSLQGGSVAYDITTSPATSGLDINHIAIDRLNSTIDSIGFHSSSSALHLAVRGLKLREKCGLEISHLAGHLQMDTLHLSTPDLSIKTPDSELTAQMEMDMDALGQDAPGKICLRLLAEIGKQDLMKLTGLTDEDNTDRNKEKNYSRFFRQYPNAPLAVRISVDGNMQKATLHGLELSLPTAFKLTAKGEAQLPTVPEKMKAHVTLNAETRHLGFATLLLPQDAGFTIPDGITLKSDIKADGKLYAADMTLYEGQGKVAFKGRVDMGTMAYKAALNVDSLNLHHFLPHDSLFHLSCSMEAEGKGTDFRSPRCLAKANAQVKALRYGAWNIDSLQLTAGLAEGIGHLRINSHNQLLDGIISLDALLRKHKVEATISADVNRADLNALRLMDRPFETSLCCYIDLASDLDQYYMIQGSVNDLTIRDGQKTYRPTSLEIDALTRPDTTWAKVASGDFSLNLTASGGYRRLGSQGQQLMDEIAAHIRDKVIDQPRLRTLLPIMTMRLRSGTENPIANFMRFKGIDFKDLALAIDASPEKGLNGGGHIYSLVADSTRIDTIRLQFDQKGPQLSFTGLVRNNPRNPQFVFQTRFNGLLLERGAQCDVTYYDAANRVGIQLGAKAEMCDSGINVHFLPYRPVLGYKAFNLNENNYIFMGGNKRIEANIDLVADDGTGVKVYSGEQNPTMLQDITVSLNKFDLEKITSVIPYAPRVTGLLNGDFHVLQDSQERFSMLSDLSIKNMTYEKCPMGNLSSEFVYLQREDSAHYVEARLNQNGREIGILNGSYKAEGKGFLDATLDMERLPLGMINGFVPDRIVGFEGYAEGFVSIKGPLDKPDVNGEVYLDSSYLVSVPYGMTLRFDNDPVRVVGSNLLMENFTVYAHNDNPLNIYGNVNFTNLERIYVDMKMRAQNYQIVNAKKNRRSLVYGKAFVNFGGTVTGTPDKLKLRGQLDVLGSTDMTYILKDSPLNTDDQLRELVTFVDFNDTSTGKESEKPMPDGLDMLLIMNVEQGARIVCALNTDETNYVNLEGGGELRMTYTPSEQLQLFGRYTLNSGEMKYALPIIPLKTFTIQPGSYIEFTGDIMNPRLDLTATEEVKALVGAETSTSRSVLFECGVKVTQTLSNMGLEFTLDAPEDLTVKNELAAMGVEQRGKLAVTMLTTGMYLADGNTSGFSMNSALNSFLQSEINNITKNAMRSVDLSLGLDQSSDAAGNTHTDYSFKFAKRFWNNRINVIVGGKISSGSSSTTATTEDETLIDNVSLEYRLDQSAQRYLRLFYNKESNDLLEGRISEYGAGFVWRKKMDKLHQIFDIRNKTKTTPTK